VEAVKPEERSVKSSVGCAAGTEAWLWWRFLQPESGAGSNPAKARRTISRDGEMVLIPDFMACSLLSASGFFLLKSRILINPPAKKKANFPGNLSEFPESTLGILSLKLSTKMID